MKVLFLLGSLNRGGTETLVLDVLNNAMKYDFDVNCVYRIKGGAIENDFLNSNIKIDYLPYKGKNLIQYLLSLRNYVVKNKITLLHAHQPVDALYSFFACIGLKLPVVLTLHGYDFNYSKISSLILIFSLRLTNLNIYVSNTQRKYYIKKYNLKETKQSVVYNCIDYLKLPSIDTNSIEGINLRKELGIDSNKLLIVTVGNFNEVRDQYTICEFLKLLKTRFTNFHFVFIGGKVKSNPLLFEKCYQYCEYNNLMTNVSFLGIRKDVPQLLSQSDLFIYSTNHDTFGIAVVEAMATQIPVFVNDWGVMNEITGVGKYATLYKTKDQIDLLRNFMLFLQDETDYKLKAKKAADYVKEKFSIHTHINNLNKEYRKLFL